MYIEYEKLTNLTIPHFRLTFLHQQTVWRFSRYVSDLLMQYPSCERRVSYILLLRRKYKKEGYPSSSVGRITLIFLLQISVRTLLYLKHFPFIINKCN